MLARHLEGLLNFTLFPITNAIAEGFNSKIQPLKAVPPGFRMAALPEVRMRGFRLLRLRRR
jgi:transposase